MTRHPGLLVSPAPTSRRRLRGSSETSVTLNPKNWAIAAVNLSHANRINVEMGDSPKRCPFFNADTNAGVRDRDHPEDYWTYCVL